MSYITRSLINRVDELFTQDHLRLWGERKGCLSTFLFHRLFRDKSEFRHDLLNIHQGVTVEQFEIFIEYFLEQHYELVRPKDIVSGLEPQMKHVLITFDDRYLIDHFAVGVLNKFQVPAAFSISTNHILKQKSFWWAVVARERWNKGVSADKIHQEQISLKAKKNDEIREYIVRHFGASALRPIAHIDRPFTVDEPNSFAAQPMVQIGNHTSNHAILTNYSYIEVKAEMQEAQQKLKGIIGVTPEAVSYPNGNYSENVVLAARELGLK